MPADAPGVPTLLTEPVGHEGSEEGFPGANGLVRADKAMDEEQISDDAQKVSRRTLAYSTRR